jgi:integrase
MATIRKRGSKWQAQIRKSNQPAITKSFTSKTEAKQWVKMVESEIERGVFINHSLAETTSFNELLDRYLLEIAPSKRSLATIKSRIKNLKIELGYHTISAIKPNLLSTYRDKRSSLVSLNAARKDLQFIRMLLNVADREWGIRLPHGNPANFVRMPPDTPARDRRLNDSELSEILSVISQDVKPIIQFAVETGMRRSEITNLEWQHINIKNRTAHIPITKTDTPRTIPLSHQAVAILKSLPRQINGKVFWVRPKTVTAAFKRACDQAKIIDLRFHDLRHEATSRFFEKGLNVMEVSSITGHKDLKMLKRYTHLKAEDLAKKLG